MFQRKARRLVFIFLIVATVVVASSVLTFYFGKRVLWARESVQVHRDVMDRLAQVVSSLKDAETGQRGYLLTGKDDYLAPYNEALIHLPIDLHELNALHAHGVSPDEIDSIEQLISLKMNELQTTIKLRREQGVDSAKSVVEQDTGKQTMDQIRLSIARLTKNQQKDMDDAASEADRATKIRTVVFLLTGVTNLCFLGWAYFRIRNEILAHQEATILAQSEREEARRQKDLLGITLASIGDCVIVTDAECRINFMNEVAEKLTGWSMAEAQSKPVGDVFKIINEQSREPVESPVEKVIKTGLIVGLANHTLLIRKDGTEVPIDDSGAPIRGADGNIRGVILVFRDFSDFKIKEHELIEARKMAEAASKAKDQFLAMLSHELRTPLTPVLATLQLWEVSNQVPAHMAADVQMLRRSVELEARIIDDLLDLTRIAKGMFSFTPEVTSICELMNLLVGMYQSEINGKRLQVTTDFQAERCHVLADPARLQQVLWNILRNATKFTEEGGDIHVQTVNDAENNVFMTVTDTGIGMSQETLDRLFLPFEQGHGNKEISRRYGGLGLGLSISKALVELLGGQIYGKSDGPGRGSSFTLIFPTVETPTDTQPNPAPSRTSQRQSFDILLIEDHRDTALSMKRLLELRGHRVQHADCLAAAYDVLSKNEFDLLLCDIGLPDGTGPEFIAEVRKIHQTPAIAISGFGMEEDIERCLHAGFNAHLTKPVNFFALESAIAKIMAPIT